MTLTIIAAVADGGAIGRRGDLAFHISPDLKRFKALTMGCPVIMGRKTFRSLPKGALPGRRNIVLTRDASFSAPGVEVFGSLKAALQAVADSERAFVIGGGEVYRQAIPLADSLEITRIYAACPDADTFFPALDGWTADPQPRLADEKSGLEYSFLTYRKI